MAVRKKRSISIPPELDAERGERRMWARHRALLLRRVVPVVPAPVVAQCWRGPARQAQLARLLAGCQVEPFDDTRARATGTLAGRADTTDIVDACVVEGALRRDDLVISEGHQDVGDRVLRYGTDVSAAVVRQDRLDGLEEPARRVLCAFAGSRPRLARTGSSRWSARLALVGLQRSLRCLRCPFVRRWRW